MTVRWKVIFRDGHTEYFAFTNHLDVARAYESFLSYARKFHEESDIMEFSFYENLLNFKHHE